MDPQARHATWDLITALRGDGVGVILTTHFMEEAERLADHVVIIDHGRVVADGARASSPAPPGSCGSAPRQALTPTACSRRCRRAARPRSRRPATT